MRGQAAPAVVALEPSDGGDPPPRRLGRPTLSNEALLDKALDLFLENGFERTSIDAITAAAGMAKRTVYQRYGDKMTLFRAALKRAIDEWILPIKVLRAAETGDFEQTLLSVGRILVANIMSPAGIRLLRISNAESVRLPEIGPYTYELGTARTIAYLADLFRRHVGEEQAAGEWTDAAIAFLYLVVTGPPTMTAWGLSLDEESIDRQLRFGVRLFLHGLIDRRPEHGHPLAGSEQLSEPPAADELIDENRRLKQLLVNSMLELSALKEEQEKQAGSERGDRE